MKRSKLSHKNTNETRGKCRRMKVSHEIENYFHAAENERKYTFGMRIIYWTNLCVCVTLLPGDPVTPVTVIITSNYRHARRSLLWNILYLFHEKFRLFLTTANIWYAILLIITFDYVVDK